MSVSAVYNKMMTYHTYILPSKMVSLVGKKKNRNLRLMLTENVVPISVMGYRIIIIKMF